MTLLEKQQKFTLLISWLITDLYVRGYKISLGEAWRSAETCALYAKEGKGIFASNHQHRLAIDLELFKNGVWLTKTPQYLEAGEMWEKYSDTELNCVWGGRFSRPDGNHFSIEHLGVK